MLSRDISHIFYSILASAKQFYTNYQEGIVALLSKQIDKYILNQKHLIEFYDLFANKELSCGLTYLMLHEFKNPELKNVLITHRGTNYLNTFILLQKKMVEEIKNINLLNPFFSGYSHQVFAQTQMINKQFIVDYLLNFPDASPDLMSQLFCLVIRSTDKCNTLTPEFNTICKQTMLGAAKKLLNHPQKAALLAKHLSALGSLELYYGGQSTDNYRAWIKQLLSHLPTPQKCHQPLVDALEEYLAKANLLNNPLEDFCINNEWKFLRIQGRTILLQNHEGNILANKIKKEKESITELYKEFNTLTFLKQHAQALELKSYLPLPIGIKKINLADLLKKSGASENLDVKDLISLIGEETDQVAYLYEVEASYIDYFIYLQNIKISHEIFCEANQNIISDLFTLLANGMVFHQLADLFHDEVVARMGHNELGYKRDDEGHYFVFADLLRWQGAHGTGEIANWKKAVEFPNLRGCKGIADIGDWVSISEYCYGKFSDKYFLNAKNMHKEKASHYILANIMAEYLYTLFLIAGKRGYDLTEQTRQSGKSPAEIGITVDQIWLKLAKQQLDNCAQALSLFSPLSNNQAKEYMLEVTNIDHLAKQMQWWMTESYIEDFKKNSIPTGIYDATVKVSLNFSKIKPNTFNDKVGLSMNGVDQDLGTDTGQEPIKEFNKMLYWMVGGVVCSYHVFNKANQEMDCVAMQLDLIDKIHKELAQPTLNPEEIRLAIFKLNALQKECVQLEWTQSLSKEQLKTLLIYREKFYQNKKISQEAQHKVLEEVRTQHAKRVIQDYSLKFVQKLKEHKAKNVTPSLPPLTLL